MIYANPGSPDAVISFEQRYGNYINGEFVSPVKGEYFDNVSPVNGEVFCQIPRSTAEDIDLALDAAHAAAPAWGGTSAAERSNILLRIADRIEQNLEKLAVAETWDNGKAVRETLNADLPLAVDHFRYLVSEGKEEIIPLYKKSCYTLGKPVRYMKDGHLKEALAIDIDDHGSLIIEDNNKERDVLRFGEVQIIKGEVQNE